MAKVLQQQSSAELLTDPVHCLSKSTSLRCSDSERGLLLGECKSHLVLKVNVHLNVNVKVDMNTMMYMSMNVHH